MRGRERDLEKHKEWKRRLREKRVVKNQVQVGEVDIAFFFFYLLYLVDETLRGILKCMGEVHTTIF